MEIDRFDRRAVGLFDLVRGEWAWTNSLPWPDTHEAPYIFKRHLVVRFVRNAARSR